MQSFYNLKVLRYPDGRCIYYFASKSIFSPQTKNEYLEELGFEYGQIHTNSEGVKVPRVLKAEPSDRDISRAKRRIFDRVYLNEWDYFVTLTLKESADYDRSDPQSFVNKLQFWLKNMAKRHGLKYLLVPERHKNGGVHFHLLTNDALSWVDSGTRTVVGFDKPLKLETIARLGVSDRVQQIVYNCPQWCYGWTTAIKCYGDKLQLSNYVTKYITKDLHRIFGHYYWCSQGLQTEPPVTYDNAVYEVPDGAEYVTLWDGTRIYIVSDMVWRGDRN